MSASEDDTTVVKGPSQSLSSCAAAGKAKVELKRQVSFIGGVNLIVGTIIGSGIFISPKGVFENAGSVGLGLVIWLACGLFATLGALSYAELGTMIPKSGGEYPILLEAFGPATAYLFAWTATLITKPASLSLLALTFARYTLAPFYGNCELPEIVLKLVAGALILTIMYINCTSVKAATKLLTIFGFGKMISLVIIIVAGIVRICQGYTENLRDPFVTTSSPGLREVTLAFYQGLWAVDGWNQLNYVIEELKDPHKNLPRAIVTSMAIITTLYVATNVAYFTVLNFNELLESPAVAVSFGATTLGVMAWIIPVSVASSVVGTCLAVCFTAGRISHVAAREGHFSLLLAMVHVKRFTPSPSVILNGTIALLMLIPNDFDTLVQYYGFATAAYYLAACLALLWFRYKMPDRPRPVKVPIIVPILFILFAACIMVFPIVDKPEIQYFFAITSILFGYVFYIPFVVFKVQSKIIRRLSVFFQKLMMVSYPENYFE